MKKYFLNIYKNPLFSGSAVMIGGSMLANVVNYAYHLIVGRLLGPVDYGILASLFSILYIVGIVPTSTSIAIVKFISSSKTKKDVSIVYNSINRFVFRASIIIATLTILASPYIAKFLQINNVLLIVLISPILFLSLLTLVNQATSQGLLKFMGFVLPTLVSSLGKLVFGIILIILGFNVFGAMWGIVLGAMFAYFISILFVKNIINNKQKVVYDLKPFLKYSFPVLIQSLAFTSLFTTDIILVKHFLSPFDAGIYAALSTLGKIIFFASSPISAVMFPVIVNKKTKGEKYYKVFWISFFSTLAISSIIVILYYLLPNLAIGILYGRQYLSASVALVWMGIFTLFYTMSILLVNFSLSIGKIKIIVIPVLAAVMQGIFLWYYHANIIQVIQVSSTICILMFLGLSIYLGYNSVTKNL